MAAVRNNTVAICDGGTRLYFDDIVDAALAAAISVRQRTDADNNEHGRVIYKSESGRYYLGADIVGQHNELSFESVPGVKNNQLPDNVVAAVHSHPNCNGHQGNVFSAQDAYFVECNQIDLYLAAPNGVLYVLTPEETDGCDPQSNPWIIDTNPTEVKTDSRLIPTEYYECKILEVC